MGQKYANISDLYKQVKLNEQEIIERKLPPQELEDREKIAKKLPMADFKKRYGKDAMAVKMATATNIVKKKSQEEETELDENIPKSTMYALVKDGKVVAKGSKRDMTSKMKKEGGKIFNAPSKKVGDTMKEDIQTWYESVDTRMKYQLDHGDDWWWKMNEVHDKMLEKLGLDEGCSIDDDETPKQRMTIKEFSLRNIWGEITEKAEYNGRPVELNNPTRGDRKKYKVYVRNDKGNVVKVEYGDPNMEIKRDDPARRKSFRARHNCDNPGPKYKARYWSCKFWEKGKSVTDLMKG